VAEFARVKRNPIELYAAMLPLLLTLALGAMGSADSRYERELGAMVLLVAAARHRRRKGYWPTTIAAIDPAILPCTPVDPLSGRPFLLERRDGQPAPPRRRAVSTARWTRATPEKNAWPLAVR
jgi:hypothetical protein